MRSPRPDRSPFGSFSTSISMIGTLSHDFCNSPQAAGGVDKGVLFAAEEVSHHVPNRINKLIRSAEFPSGWRVARCGYSPTWVSDFVRSLDADHGSRNPNSDANFFEIE